MSQQDVDLERFSLQEREVAQALARVNVRDVDYADIYFESTIAEAVSMEEGIVKRAVKSISQGAPPLPAKPRGSLRVRFAQSGLS